MEFIGLGKCAKDSGCVFMRNDGLKGGDLAKLEAFLTQKDKGYLVLIIGSMGEGGTFHNQCEGADIIYRTALKVYREKLRTAKSK